jgi:hypothetical protein
LFLEENQLNFFSSKRFVKWKTGLMKSGQNNKYDIKKTSSLVQVSYQILILLLFISWLEFIEEEAAKHGIDLPVENPCDNLRSWLQEQKLSALKKNSNRAEKGKNWGVFDFCNQFLQNDEQLKQATLDLCQRLWRKNVVYAEIRFCPELHTEKGLDADQALQSVIAG